MRERRREEEIKKKKEERVSEIKIRKKILCGEGSQYEFPRQKPTYIYICTHINGVYNTCKTQLNTVILCITKNSQTQMECSYWLA